MKKFKYLIVVLVAILLSGGCSFNEEESNNKQYYDNGFSITLPSDFYKKDLASVTVYYESEYAIVTALKESFTTLETVGLNSNSSIEDYAKAVIKNNKQDDADLQLSEDGNFAYFVYEKEVSGKEFYYTAVVYKADDAFWLVNFACEDKNKEEYSEKFIDWASTIEV